MQLHVPAKREKGRWYCGPFALAAITGMSFEEVRAAINIQKGRSNLNQGILGTSNAQMVNALGDAGYKVIKVFNRADDKLTFSQWQKQWGIDASKVYLIELTGHWVTVQGGYFIDNHTQHKVHLAYAPWKRKRVKTVYQIAKNWQGA